MMYSKLFSSLVHSSLWCQPDHIRLLFITLLALSDRDGIIYGSRAGLERAACIDPDACLNRDPWKELMEPDSNSSDLLRNPDNEGRRIEEIPGGFKIINYTYYRGLRDAEDRRIQNQEAQRRHRQKVSPSKPGSAKLSQRHDIESKSEIKIKKDGEGANGSRPTPVEDWLKELESDKTYQGINVRVEYGKMLNWCKVHAKQATKRRFVNWLNHTDRPLPSQHVARPDYKRNYLPPPRELSDEEFEAQRKIALEETKLAKEAIRNV